MTRHSQSISLARRGESTLRAGACFDIGALRPVVQEDPTGCGIACAAALTRTSYAAVKKTAARLGITPEDSALWSSIGPMRRLLAELGLGASRREQAFRGWDALPDTALLAIKWHLGAEGPAWHWVVFRRDEGGARVLDPKRSLRRHVRTDFGRMKPRWYLRISG